MKTDAARVRRRVKAQKRLPIQVRRQLLDAIYAVQPFRQVLRDLCLTPNQVWGITKTDPDWSAALEAALTTTRRDDLSTALMRRTCTVACARSVGITSVSGWAGVGKPERAHTGPGPCL